jgi:YD repeat-containing protein
MHQMESDLELPSSECSSSSDTYAAGHIYDSNGNKLTDTDANGHVTHYVYGVLNRLTETTYPDSTTSSRTYNFRGNVLTETDQAGHVTRHEFDLAGREVSVTRAYGTSDASSAGYQ